MQEERKGGGWMEMTMETVSDEDCVIWSSVELQLLKANANVFQVRKPVAHIYANQFPVSCRRYVKTFFFIHEFLGIAGKKILTTQLRLRDIFH